MATSKPQSKTELAKLSTNNYLIVLLLISLLAIGVAGFISKVLVTSVIRDTKIISAKDKANRQLDANLTAAPQLVQSYQGLNPSQTTVLGHALPTTTDFPAIISMMEVIGAQSGMIFTSVSTDNSGGGMAAAPAGSAATDTTTPVPQNVSISTGISGSYPALLKTLTNLETSARPVRVTGLQLSGTGSTLTGTLTFTTYYQDKAVLPFSTRTIK